MNAVDRSPRWTLLDGSIGPACPTRVFKSASRHTIRVIPHSTLPPAVVMFAKLAALVSVLVALAPTPASALWPLPASIQSGSSALTLASGFKINLNVPHAPSDLQAAVQRTEQFIQKDKLGRLVVGRGSSDAPALAHAKALGALNVELAKGVKGINSISADATADIDSRDEAYTLTVPADGSAATLTAKSALGLFRGLTTFSQMWYDYNGKTYTVSAPYAIQDAPAYVRAHMHTLLFHVLIHACSRIAASCSTPPGTGSRFRISSAPLTPWPWSRCAHL
jgi:hypothetical protein